MPHFEVLLESDGMIVGNTEEIKADELSLSSHPATYQFLNHHDDGSWELVAAYTYDKVRGVRRVYDQNGE